MKLLNLIKNPFYYIIHRKLLRYYQRILISIGFPRVSSIGHVPSWVWRLSQGSWLVTGIEQEVALPRLWNFTNITKVVHGCVWRAGLSGGFVMLRFAVGSSFGFVLGFSGSQGVVVSSSGCHVQMAWWADAGFCFQAWCLSFSVLWMFVEFRDDDPWFETCGCGCWWKWHCALVACGAVLMASIRRLTQWVGV